MGRFCKAARESSLALEIFELQGIAPCVTGSEMRLLLGSGRVFGIAHCCPYLHVKAPSSATTQLLRPRRSFKDATQHFFNSLGGKTWVLGVVVLRRESAAVPAVVFLLAVIAHGVM